MRLVGSLVVHAVIGAVLFAIARPPARPPSGPRVTIEVVDLQLPPAPVQTIDVTTTLPGSAEAPAGGAARTEAPERSSAPKRVIVASREATARSISRPSLRTDPAAATTDAFDDPRGAITFEEPPTLGQGTLDPDGAAGGSGSLDGLGAGRGNGRGTGIGFGDGGGVTGAAPPPPPPPAPKVSKARPARLMFPSRQRDVDDGELYVMRVTVDADGFVAGATLVRGFGGRRDDIASAQIWRFRYDPARDDNGQPVRSVVEQRFLVQ